jgi:3-hydroxy-9,10-secoandrosta-1,3,5(10)-triene-9,17-dione monooxygenase reductase component
MTPELVGPFPLGQNPEDYDRLRRRVLWAFPTGLFVVGTAGELDGRRCHNLMTANLVVQVATDPKLVAVAIETSAVSAALVASGRCFAVSGLAREDRAVVRRFVKPVQDVVYDEAGRPAEMAGEAVRVGATGAPILARAALFVDCSVRELVELGSHVLAVGEVLDAGGRPGEVEILRMEDTRMSYGG